jgi:small subunit ribosomal protein S8
MPSKARFRVFVNHRGNMDAVSNLLNSLINAQRVGKAHVMLPYSRLALDIGRFLQERGLVAKVREEGDTKKKIVITLAYDDEQPRLHGVRRLSKPGQRRYVGKDTIPYSYDGVGTVIVSTSQGLLDDSQARQKGVGGEILAEVW